MAEGETRLRVNLASQEEADAIAAEVEQLGGTAEVSEERGIFPLLIPLIVVIPPGVALLAQVINRIVHSWRDHGVLIDARGTGAPTLTEEKGLPYGTVVILTRDGQQATRSDLPEADLSKYIGAAVHGLSGGASAGAAKQLADAALKA